MRRKKTGLLVKCGVLRTNNCSGAENAIQDEVQKQRNIDTLKASLIVQNEQRTYREQSTHKNCVARTRQETNFRTNFRFQLTE